MTYSIDQLTYTYKPNSNRLDVVHDNSNSLDGFRDGNWNSTDYEYDDNGNMIIDRNKGIQTISYNHLNLPDEITFSNDRKITYLYNALGSKIRKSVTMPSQVETTDYLGGFQYKNGVIQFFPTAEGYVNVTDGTFFNYVYNYTDHLGNIRLSYTQSGTELKILEENHYYPFGLKHNNYNTDKVQFKKSEFGTSAVLQFAERNNNQYKYNGKEFQDELGLNVTAMDYRQYDMAIGRFNSIDALSEMSFSTTPFAFSRNNPIFWMDPSGLLSQEFINSIWCNSNNSSGKTVWTNTGSSFSSEDIGNGKAGSVDNNTNVFTGFDALSEVTITRNNRGDASYLGQLQSHVYWTGKYYQGWRDNQNEKNWSDFAEGLQNTGDVIAGAGYVLTLTGFGAGIGVPLAALGNGISTTGAVIGGLNSFYHQGITSKDGLKTTAFIVAGDLAGHYLNKVPGLEPTIKLIDGTEVINLSNKILKQNISLKLMGIERYYDYKTKKE